MQERNKSRQIQLFPVFAVIRMFLIAVRKDEGGLVSNLVQSVCWADGDVFTEDGLQPASWSQVQPAFTVLYRAITLHASKMTTTLQDRDKNLVVHCFTLLENQCWGKWNLGELKDSQKAFYTMIKQAAWEELGLTFHSSWTLLPGGTTPLCMSWYRCRLLSSASDCISALCLFILKLTCGESFPGCGALLALSFPPSVCVVGVFFPLFRNGALFTGADLNTLARLTCRWLLLLGLSWLEAGVERSSSCCLTTALPGWSGGWVESLAFAVTYVSTKCTCFCRSCTKVLWREARENIWLFNKRCRRWLGTVLRRETTIHSNEKCI